MGESPLATFREVVGCCMLHQQGHLDCQQKSRSCRFRARRMYQFLRWIPCIHGIGYLEHPYTSFELRSIGPPDFNRFFTWACKPSTSLYVIERWRGPVCGTVLCGEAQCVGPSWCWMQRKPTSWNIATEPCRRATIEPLPCCRAGY